MNSTKTYAPILRFKKSERTALEKLTPETRARLTPILEIVMPSPTRDKDDYKIITKDSRTVLGQKLPTVAEEIGKV